MKEVLYDTIAPQMYSRGVFLISVRHPLYQNYPPGRDISKQPPRGKMHALGGCFEGGGPGRMGGDSGILPLPLVYLLLFTSWARGQRRWTLWRSDRDRVAGVSASRGGRIHRFIVVYLLLFTGKGVNNNTISGGASAAHDAAQVWQQVACSQLSVNQVVASFLYIYFFCR